MILLLAFLLGTAAAQGHTLLVSATDANGNALAGARMTLRGAAIELRCSTSARGLCRFRNLPPGSYDLTVERDTFYVVHTAGLRVPDASHIDVVLQSLEEIRESVEVIASAPGIDPAQPAAAESLGAQEVLNVPFPSSRDLRNALVLLPNVVQDNFGDTHLAGAAGYQTLHLLDGFNVGHAVVGGFAMRVSTDALRGVDTQTSRYSAEFGRASGGLLALTTAMGTDKWRFNATNVIPSLQLRRGVSFDKWVPRATLSGPLRRGKAWFLTAADGEYTVNIDDDLPAGADRNIFIRFADLTKFQVNLTPAHILSASFVVDHARNRNPGLSPFNPLESTVTQQQTILFGSLRDQYSFSGGTLLELGVAYSRSDFDERPQGSATYVIHPDRVSGNFFRHTTSLARRAQALMNVFLPAVNWHGRHEFRLGADVEARRHRLLLDRQPFLLLREDGTLFRRSSFPGEPLSTVSVTERGVYLQDRWTPVERLLVEAGLRVDTDTLVREAMFSPRLALTWMLDRAARTKLSAGIGIYHDAVNLETLARGGERLDEFFAADGVTPTEALLTTFTAAAAPLRPARFVNSSLGIERELPWSLYLHSEYVRKRGRDAPLFVNQTPLAERQGDYLLLSQRRDRYDALTTTLRWRGRQGHGVLASYVRSAARSNAVLDFYLDNPIFSAQAAGPVFWDAPHRLINWGWLPVPRTKKWTVSWFVEWRSGFPLTVFNEQQQVIGAANRLRFPDRFSLDLAVERRLTLLGYELALRGGVENITSHFNPTCVNNNADSPNFLRFACDRDRALVARIRIIGRK